MTRTSSRSGGIYASANDLLRWDRVLAGDSFLSAEQKAKLFRPVREHYACGWIVKKSGLDGLVANFLKVVASNRRLFAVPGIIEAFRAIVAEHKGVVTADVASAFKLTAAQEKELKATLKDVAGKDVDINVTVDPSLLGGLSAFTLRYRQNELVAYAGLMLVGACWISLPSRV